jgi:hypothetical protein
MTEIREIKKSQNFLQIAGTLLEKNIEIVTMEIEITDFKHNNTKKKITCEVARKKDFKNPALLVECSPKDENGNVRYTAQLGVDFMNIKYGVASKQFDDKGNIVDSENFKGIKTVLDTYIAKAEAKTNEESTRVYVKSGFLIPNEYANSQGEFKTYIPTITTFNVTSTNVPEDICEGNLSGVIRTMIREVRGEQQEETGRVKIDFYYFDNKGATYPVTFMVEKDLADDVERLYENGQSVKFYYEFLTNHIGAKKIQNESGFGRRQTNTTSGFDVLELSVFRGEEPFEEEHELFVPIDLMKKAIADRQNMIDTKCREAKEKGNNKDNKSNQKSGLGARKPMVVEETADNDINIDSCPF